MRRSHAQGVDPNQPHIWYEVCNEHGMFLDAGEFTDYKYETLLDKFRDLITGTRAPEFAILPLEGA